MAAWRLLLADNYIRPMWWLQAPGPVSLAEPVPRVGHGEGAVLLCRQLNPISGAVVGWWRRRAGTGLRRRNRRDRHARRWLVSSIGDKHTRRGVLLAAQQGEVHLPQVFQ